MPHVCVVGAGPSGLACCRWLLHEGLQVTCVEAAADVGGLWNFQPEGGGTELEAPLLFLVPFSGQFFINAGVHFSSMLVPKMDQKINKKQQRSSINLRPFLNNCLLNFGPQFGVQNCPK